MRSCDAQHKNRKDGDTKGFHHCGHAAQAQLNHAAIEFDQVHGLGSSKLMRCWIRSRNWLSSRIINLGLHTEFHLDDHPRFRRCCS